jgi:hypothetical protein
MLETYVVRLVFTMIRIQIEVFYVMMLCSVVGGYHCFGGPYCLHLQPADGGSKVLRNIGILPQHYATHMNPTCNLYSLLTQAIIFHKYPKQLVV